MPTPGEKKALLFFAMVFTLGVGVRGARVLHSESPVSSAARRALDAQIEAVDSVRQKVRKGKRPKKTKTATHIVDRPEDVAAPPPPAIIDIDIATAPEIETLRGIGPALAKRIVADRDSLGPFGSIDELTRVKGIGKRLAAKISPQVTFSLLPRHPHTENDGNSASPRGRRKSRRGESHI
jgi:competence protein ComEA